MKALTLKEFEETVYKALGPRNTPFTFKVEGLIVKIDLHERENALS